MTVFKGEMLHISCELFYREDKAVSMVVAGTASMLADGRKP